MSIHSSVRGWWRPALAALLTASGCASSGSSTRNPSWPYAAVISSDRVPPELQGLPLFTGRWIAAEPEENHVLAETTAPRFVASFSFEAPRPATFLDLGQGTLVENVAFVDDGESAILVAAASSLPGSQAVFARSLLYVDLVQKSLVDVISLARDGIARGFAVDDRGRRAYLLEDDGEGRGSVRIVDLYGGRRVADTPVGVVPRDVMRKGLVLNQNATQVFCLAGGESARSDFAPIHPDEPPEGPALLALDGDSLGVAGRIPLRPRWSPRAVAYDDQRSRVHVLEVDNDQSLLVIFDAAFLEERTHVNIPEETTDIVILGGYAFLPGSTGIYIVDLDLETLVSSPRVSFGLTGEIAVSRNLDTALVLFQSAGTGGRPGIAQVSLQSGQVVDLLQ